MATKISFLLVLAVCWVALIQAAPDRQALNNNPTFRGFSNYLDRALGWGGYDDPRDSKIRATLHAGYHEAQYHISDNPREHERAKDQWGIVTGGSRDNLKRYNEQHGN